MPNPSSEGRGFIVALRAYFDESGTHWGGDNASDVFVLCGYLAPESLWEDKTPDGFLARWNNVMHGRPFHAKEMEGNPQGAQVKLALSNLLNSCGLIGIRAGISISAYREILLPHILECDGDDNPYRFLFADVIAEVVKRSVMFIGEDTNEPISFFFADIKTWSQDALNFYRHVRDDTATPREVSSRMGAIAFEDIKQFVPLQAADHLAFESWHFMTDPPGKYRPAMNVLMNWPQNHGIFFKQNTLELYVERAMAEGRL